MVKVTNNGWAVDPSGLVDVGRGGDTGKVREGDVATVFQHFLDRYHDEVEDVRIVNGYRTSAFNASVGGVSTSNHISATALDVNGDDHPYEASLPVAYRYSKYKHGFTQDQIIAINNILAFFEGVLKWGLYFNAGYRDGMHYEIRGTAIDVARIANKIRDLKQPAPALEPEPTQEPNNMEDGNMRDDIAIFYSVYLGRVASESEIQFWVTHSAKMRLSRNDVRDRIAKSKEAQTYAINWAYANLLGRKPDPQGFQTWINISSANGWEFDNIWTEMTKQPEAIAFAKLPESDRAARIASALK